ncbi:hypothetical protein V5305_11360, partial [Escherichia coli]|uniref:hypothetical protein n=1 Tax=Escherichia coli TaxID=562 RepID=UPI002FD3CC49
LRDKWSHFLPESITDLPLVARHTSPSEIIILYYLTIPFGIGSKENRDQKQTMTCNILGNINFMPCTQGKSSSV